MKFKIGRFLKVHKVPEDITHVAWARPFKEIGQLFLIKDLSVHTHLMERPCDLILEMDIEDVDTGIEDSIYIFMYVEPFDPIRGTFTPNWGPKYTDILLFQQHIHCIEGVDNE